MNNSQSSGIDLNFRPEGYWSTPDPTLPLLEAIKDPTKRARAEELAKAFDRQQISALNERGELTNEEEDFFFGCGFGIFDGEDADNPLEAPMEVAGAGFDLGDGFASSRFSVLILSKRCAGQSAYRLQGPSEDSSNAHDYGTEETSPNDWIPLEHNQCLTLDEVAWMLEDALPQSAIDSCLQERWDYADEKTEHTLENLDVSADSGFYSKLWDVFSTKVEAWRQTIRDGGELEETAEDN